MGGERSERCSGERGGSSERKNFTASGERGVFSFAPEGVTGGSRKRESSIVACLSLPGGGRRGWSVVSALTVVSLGRTMLHSSRREMESDGRKYFSVTSRNRRPFYTLFSIFRQDISSPLLSPGGLPWGGRKMRGRGRRKSTGKIDDQSERWGGKGLFLRLFALDSIFAEKVG